MSLKKRAIILAVLLTVILLAFVFNANAMNGVTQMSGSCGENATWELTSDGTLIISGTGRVDEVSEYVEVCFFYYPWHVKSVVIEEGITNIGSILRYCESLSSVTLPSTITDIDAAAFRGCSSLKSINLPGCLTSIKNGVFEGCSSLQSITIPSGVTSIGDSAFERCSSLQSITIPSGVTSIGDSAFAGCSSLQGIRIPDGVTRIGFGAFIGCSSFKSVKIPAGVTVLESYLFAGCSSLTSVTIPDSVTSTGYAVFERCTSLSTISLPDSITELGMNGESFAFEGCSSLQNVKLPSGLQHIGMGMFKDCSSLQSVTIPGGVGGTLGWKAFENCSSLKSIDIPAGVSSIDASCFSGCTSLTNIDLRRLYGIGDSAFANCTNLMTIRISEFFDFGTNVFSNCPNLTDIIIYDDGKYLNTEWFANLDKSQVVIHCYEFSYAESWAIENGYKVKLLDYEYEDLDIKLTLLSTELIHRGSQTTLKHDILISGNADNLKPVWESSAPEIVSVDENGLLTALQRGQAIITLRVGNESASCTVTVDVPMEGFTLSTNDLYVEAAQQGKLSIAEVQPADADNQTFEWTSADDVYASVDETGLVTAKKAVGTVTISVRSANGKTASCTVHVCYPVETIAFEQQTYEAEVGTTLALQATVKTRDQSYTNQLVSFSSSDNAIATVNEKGEVTPLLHGIVTITAVSAGGVTASCEITVHQAEIDAAVAPTTSSTGLTEGKHCSVCGKVLISQEEIPMLERVAGDATGDGKVSTADFLRLGKYLAGWETITIDASGADVTGDGKVSTADFLRLGKYLAGWGVALE